MVGRGGQDRSGCGGLGRDIEIAEKRGTSYVTTTSEANN
jgi:hypothetical protein